MKIKVTTRSGDVQQVDAQAGISVMETIRDSGIEDILALCGGCCSCATCHVYVAEEWRSSIPPMGEDENDLLDSSPHRTEASRLSCQIEMVAELDGLSVAIAPED